MNSRVAPQDDVAQRRETILARALEAFARDGYRHTDVQDIADAANVGKGTVYRNFGSKENLFFETTFYVLRQLGESLQQAVPPDAGPKDQLRASSRAYAEFFQADRNRLEVFVQDRAMFQGTRPEKHLAYHEQLIDEYAKIVERGIAQGQFREIDPRDTVISLGAVIYGSVVFHCYAGDSLSLVERTERVIEVFLAGISRPSYAEPKRSEP